MTLLTILQRCNATVNVRTTTSASPRARRRPATTLCNTLILNWSARRILVLKVIILFSICHSILIKFHINKTCNINCCLNINYILCKKHIVILECRLTKSIFCFIIIYILYHFKV